MTVSRAFKKEASIKPEVRERILEAARRLGYEPDAMVSELMTSFASRRPVNYKETFAAIWWPERWDEVDLGQGYHTNMYRGLNEGAKLHGRKFDHIVMTKDMAPNVINRILRARNIQGVILTPPITANEKTPELDWENLSATIIGTALRHPNFHRAQASHYNVMVKALAMAHRHRYKRPCLLLHDDIDCRTNRAYTAAFMAWGHSRKYIWKANSHLSNGLPKWLNTVKPDVIIADWEIWYEYLPEEYQNCGFITLSLRSNDSPITGIYQNIANIAKCAVDLLVRSRIQHECGEPDDPVLMLTTGTWVHGTTLKLSGDPLIAEDHFADL